MCGALISLPDKVLLRGVIVEIYESNMFTKGQWEGTGFAFYPDYGNNLVVLRKSIQTISNITTGSRLFCVIDEGVYKNELQQIIRSQNKKHGYLGVRKKSNSTPKTLPKKILTSAQSTIS